MTSPSEGPRLGCRGAVRGGGDLPVKQRRAIYADARRHLQDGEADALVTWSMTGSLGRAALLQPSASPSAIRISREPPAIAANIEAALAVWVAFFVHNCSGQVGLVMAVVTAALALHTAVVTHDTLLAAGIGLDKTLLSLAIKFGLHLSPEYATAIIAFVTVSMSLFSRQQTSPVEKLARDARGRFIGGPK